MEPTNPNLILYQKSNIRYKTLIGYINNVEKYVSKEKAAEMLSCLISCLDNIAESVLSVEP